MNGLELHSDVASVARQLELSVRKIVTGDLVSSYKSSFKGSGLTFSDLIEYQPGMELRTINWKASARSPRVYSNSFTEERQLSVMIVLDLSASTRCGVAPDVVNRIQKIAGIFALVAANGGDKVGLCTFAKETIDIFPPRAHRAHLRRVLSAITRPLESADARGSRLDLALQRVLPYLRRRSVVVVVSDFFTPILDQPLHRLCKKHEVLAIRVLEPGMLRFEDLGLALFRDSEGDGVNLIDTACNRSFQQALVQSDETLHAHFARFGVEYVSLSVDPLPELVRYLTSRAHRKGSQRARRSSNIDYTVS